MQKIEDAYYGRNSIDPQIMRKITDEFGRMRHKQTSIMYFFNVLFSITPSEKELIKMLLANMTVTQIAQERYVEVSTVKSQINTLLKKFHMSRTKEITTLIRAMDIEKIFSKQDEKWKWVVGWNLFAEYKINEFLYFYGRWCLLPQRITAASSSVAPVTLTMLQRG